MQQALVLELGPELVGDRDVQPPQILLQLVDRANSEEDGAHSRMCQGKLKGCRGQRDVVSIAHRLDPFRSSYHG